MYLLSKTTPHPPTDTTAMIIFSGVVSDAQFSIQADSPLAQILTWRRRPIPQVKVNVIYDGRHQITVGTGGKRSAHKFQLMLKGSWAIDTVVRVMLDTFFGGAVAPTTMYPTNSHRVLNLRRGVCIDINALRDYIRAHPDDGIELNMCARPRRIGAGILYISMSQIGHAGRNVSAVISSNTVKTIGAKVPAPYTAFLRRYLCRTGAVMRDDVPCTDHRIAFAARDEYRHNIHLDALTAYVRKNRPQQQQKTGTRTRGAASRQAVEKAFKLAYGRE